MAFSLFIWKLFSRFSDHVLKFVYNNKRFCSNLNSTIKTVLYHKLEVHALDETLWYDFMTGHSVFFSINASCYICYLMTANPQRCCSSMHACYFSLKLCIISFVIVKYKCCTIIFVFYLLIIFSYRNLAIRFLLWLCATCLKCVIILLFSNFWYAYCYIIYILFVHAYYVPPVTHLCHWMSYACKHRRIYQYYGSLSGADKSVRHLTSQLLGDWDSFLHLLQVILHTICMRSRLC